jgi:hypothetical protein
MKTAIPDDCHSKVKADPWNIEKIQCYNPLYSLFLPLTEETYDNVTWKQHMYIVDPNHIASENFPNDKIPCKMHIKSAPLIDPIHYLIGKYDKEKEKIRNLPKLNSSTDTCMEKILDTNNTSYVDCFFNFLSSQTIHKHNLTNGIDYFGSYLAIQKTFLFNACDDLEYLQDSDYFLENDKKMYELDNETVRIMDESPINLSQGKRPKLCIQEETIMIEDVDNIFTQNDTVSDEDNIVDENEVIYEYEKDKDDADSDNSSISYSTEEEEEESDESDESDDESDESDESDKSDEADDESDEEEDKIPLYIYDFPVQMIALEKCDGTMDELLENDMMNEKQSASALIQVIFTLIAYQKMFSFTHNDLHTNNILYKHTTQSHIVYKFQKKIYRVPTYGRIFKIIDFGRAIYKFQGKKFCSDSFSPNGDAHGQYNTEPYLNLEKPRIEPNPSFDLCRLGCSLYDFVFDSEKPLPKNMTAFQKVVYSWCLDKEGMNILYKKNGDERYPNFKLYKMISRLVHDKLPHDQLSNPFFAQFLHNGKTKPKDLINLDELPYYGE